MIFSARTLVISGFLACCTVSQAHAVDCNNPQSISSIVRCSDDGIEASISVPQLASAVQDVHPEELALSSPSYYSRVSAMDIKLNAGSLIGQKIETEGYLGLLGNKDGVFLRSPFDLGAVAANMQALPNDYRRWLYDNCFPTCRLTVRGTISRNARGTTINVESIE